MDRISLHTTRMLKRMIINTLAISYFDSCTSVSSNSNRHPSQGSYCYLDQSRQSLLNELKVPEFKIMKGNTILCS